MPQKDPWKIYFVLFCLSKILCQIFSLFELYVRWKRWKRDSEVRILERKWFWIFLGNFFFFENFFSKTFFWFFFGKYFEKKNFFFRLLFRKRREHKTWKNFFLTFFLKKSNHLTKNFIQILKGSFEWHSDFFYLISLALSNSSGESLEFRKRWCSRVSPWQ